jgi:hypothetical protein
MDEDDKTQLIQATPLEITGTGKLSPRDSAEGLVEYFFNMEDQKGGKYSTVFGVKTNFEKQMNKMMQRIYAAKFKMEDKK